MHFPIIWTPFSVNQVRCSGLFQRKINKILKRDKLTRGLRYKGRWSVRLKDYRVIVETLSSPFCWSWPGGWDIPWKENNRIRGALILQNGVEASAANLYLALNKISNSLSAFLFSYLFFGDKKKLLKFSWSALSFLDYLILMN